MIKIPLTQGKVAIVDDNYAHLSSWKWYAVKANNTWYAVRQFRKEDGTQRLMHMHHAIIGRPINRKMDTDHKNGDGLINTKANLRHVTRSENRGNSKARREGKTTSKFVGVYWNKYRGKWHVHINFNGKDKYIGLFKNEKKASNAYKKYIKNILYIRQPESL